MTGNELIAAVQALSAEDRELPVVGYEGSFLIELERPRVTYRDAARLETHASLKTERVLAL